jgi:molecular chaperone HscA
MTAGAARVRVTFQVDADGLLTVSARESRTGVETAVTVKPSYGLNDDDIARILVDSQRYAQDDTEARAMRELQVESQQLLDVTQSALAADGERLLDAGEHAVIEQAMETLRTALAGSERIALRAATEALNRVSSEFAARRMNSAVREALTGHKLAELEI